MATIMHNQLGAMTAAQFAALPPHLKLQNSEILSSELLMSHRPIPAPMARRLGLGHLNPYQAMEAMYGHTRAQQPALPKRPLNSWMAFRSFYARIFATLQQKDTSGHLKLLWDQEPFKAKWSIVAKAYSKIRDYVGKDNAPLDIFLELVCPEIGIIGVEDYLEKMNWSVQIAEDGVISMIQIAPSLSFEQHILYTSMSDADVIVFAAVHGYISQQVATAITGTFPQPQGLLASAPTFQLPALPRPAPPPSAAFLQTVVSDPTSAASMILGFDINGLLGPDPDFYEWTGSMSDLYNPNAGSIDFQSVADRDNADAHEWDISNIHDPRGFDSLFEDAVQGGITTPLVPDDEGGSYM